MAGFGELSGETDGESGEGRQAAGQDIAARGGLLDASSFPSVLPNGSRAEGPAIARQSPTISGSLDHDVHAQVLQDILDAQAKLPSLKSAQRPGDPANWDGGWLDHPVPLVAGPLDTDTHAEVLRDIQGAQAQLPPASRGSEYSLGNSLASNIFRPSSPYSLGNDSGGGNGGTARFTLVGATTAANGNTYATVTDGTNQFQVGLGPISSDHAVAVTKTGAYSLGTNGRRGPEQSFDQYVASEYDASPPAGYPGSSLAFTWPSSELRPVDPNITYIGGQRFRTIDTGKAERLVPDVWVSAGDPFVPAMTPREAFQKSVQENVINPSLFMISGGEGVPAEVTPSGPTLRFPADIAAARGYSGIETTANGGPTFVGTTHLYPAAEGQSNVVDIRLTGSRRRDFKAANAMAGFAKTPGGYTWHHVDDFNPATGMGSLELVEHDAHKATSPHSGSVAQYENFFGIPYRR